MSPNMAQRFFQSLFSGCTIMHTIHDFLLQHKIKTNMKVWRLYIQHKMVRQYPQWCKHCSNSCSHCDKACIVLVWAFCILVPPTQNPTTQNTHYRRRLLCRVSHTLPSAFYRALGKEAVYRVPQIKHSANNWHSAKRGFAECRALGKK